MIKEQMMNSLYDRIDEIGWSEKLDKDLEARHCMFALKKF